MQSEVSRIQVLLVDDSRDDREYFHQLIADVEGVKLDVEESDNASDALEKLIIGKYDCAIVDYNMPGYNGKWLVQEMTRRGIPTASIILTGGGNERIAVESMKCGSQDYLCKSDVSPEQLEHSIKQALQSKSRQVELLHRANFDTLTGVSKREHFLEALDTACSKADRFGRHLAVLYLDLDKFKEINDRYGHGAGDLALKNFADQLRLCARDYDTIARLGGDEFVVLLEELDGDGMLASINIAKRIIERVQSSEVTVGNISFNLNTSIGIAIYPKHTSDRVQLIELADMAMYIAKRAGGGFHIAESVVQEAKPEGLDWKHLN